MKKITFFLVFCFLYSMSFGQDFALPTDFRQQNSTLFNSSLFNPSFSLVENEPSSLSVWSRWQWQNPDADATTFFINYSHHLNAESTVGLGFLQHNTGVFLNKGAIVNYAQSVALNEKSSLTVGINLLGFQQSLADESLPIESDGDFVIQFSPGIRYQINNLSVGVSLENGINYNISQGEREEQARNLLASLSNNFYVNLFNDEKSYIKPLVYYKSIQGFDEQYGGTVLLKTNKFWLQGGYNNFYGASAGLGGTFFKKLSIGGLAEFATSSILSEADTTFELIASYHFGKGKEKTKETLEEESSKQDEEAERLAKEEAERLEIEQAKQEQAKQEAMRLQAEKEAELLKEKARIDSITKLEQTKKVEVLPGEKYEEVSNTSIEGLEPGFYLIANVFGTKYYFDAFMADLTKKGLKPSSFYRKENSFNYVYLAKYNTIEEARSARNSNLNNTYSGKMWIFRVTGY